MKPLEGVKVVELATFVAAPGASRLMAEWGAEVIKVEPISGDPNRGLGLLNLVPIDDDENPCFDSVSFYKKFISVDTRKPEGFAILEKLLEGADVFVTNYRTQVLVKMGLDYDQIKDKYPKLVWAHVLGFGEVGPEKDTAGFDYTTYGARGGLLGTTYQEGGEPINIMSAFGDFQTSICLASGICAALVNQTKTGKGDKVTASLHNAGVYMNYWGVLGEFYQGKQTFPKNRKQANTPSINTYKAKDKWIQLCGAAYNKYYNGIMRTIGREDLVDDPRYNDLATINKTGDNIEVIKIIEAEIPKKTADEWVSLFRQADVPAEKAYTFGDIIEDEQARASDVISDVVYPNGHKSIAIANPVRFGSIGRPTYEFSKRVGADTREILEKEGYSKEELDELVQAGIVKD